MNRITTLVALLVLALPAFPQQKPFEEKIDVNAVLLDVIVTDNRGNQILGLSKDDFVVKEDGVPQEIESVDYLTNRTLIDSREENAPFKVERVHEDRYFIFFFDKPSNPGELFDQLSTARQAVREFIRNDMKDTDRVAIVGHDVRLKVYSDFTSDKAALQKALDETARFGRGLTKAPAGEGPSILRAVGEKSMMDRTGSVYRALDVLGDSVKGIRGRKNVILFSPGIADIGEHVQNGMLVDRSADLDPMLRSLNAANVSVYTVQLQQQMDSSVATTPLFHQRLTEIANETGGKYFQFNTSFKPAIQSVEETNAGYYLVTYRSRKPAGEKGFQKVDVTVKNPEFRVNARSGYEYGS